jgi:phage shock protein A
MNELKHTVDGIFRKAHKLLEQKQAFEETIAKLRRESDDFKAALKEKDKKINALNEEIETIKLAKQLVDGTAGNGEFSDKINDMIKELDVVIHKLKTEKD